MLQALAEALQALPAKLTEAQAQQALAPLLEQIGKTTDPYALKALAEALQALAAKLTEAQAQQALEPLLQQIGKTTNPDALQALAQALQALAAKLTEAQAQQALTVAMSSLAWAATENEAVDWARAVVALLPSCNRSRWNPNPCRCDRLSPCRGTRDGGSPRCASRKAFGCASKRSRNGGELGMDSGKVSRPSPPSDLPATAPADLVVGPEMSCRRQQRYQFTIMPTRLGNTSRRFLRRVRAISFRPPVRSWIERALVR